MNTGNLHGRTPDLKKAGVPTYSRLIKVGRIDCKEYSINSFTDEQNHTTMRKADFINPVSEKTGVSKIDVLVTVETALLAIQQTLAAGESVFIRGFGTFAPKKRAAKTGRNIKKGEAVQIPEHYIPHFKPAREFKDKLKRLGNTKSETPAF